MNKVLKGLVTILGILVIGAVCGFIAQLLPQTLRPWSWMPFVTIVLGIALIVNLWGKK